MTAEDVTSLVDAARARHRSKERARCSVDRILEDFPELRKEINDLFEISGPGKEISYESAAEALAERFKKPMAGQTLARHMRKCARVTS